MNPVKMICLFFLSSLAIATTVPNESAAQPQVNLGGTFVNFGISPPMFEIEIGKQNQLQALRVENFGQDALELQVTVYNWELDEQNQLKLMPPTEQSLDQWMFINPVRFRVEPGKTQAIRFSLRPKAAPTEGEHRAIMYVTDVTTPKDGRRNVAGSLGVAIYGYVGTVTRIGRLHGVAQEMTQDRLTFSFDISSEGTAHVRMKGQYAIWKAAAYPGTAATTVDVELNKPDAALPEGMLAAGPLPSLPVLPGTRRAIRLPLPQTLDAGQYILDINGELSDAILDTNLPFEISQK